MQAFGTEIPYRAQAFGFEIRRSEDRAEVGPTTPATSSATRVPADPYHSVATTRFREFLPRPLTEQPANIQRVERARTPEAGRGEAALVHHVLSSARPAAPECSTTVSRRSAGSARTRGPPPARAHAARRCACGSGGRGSRPATASSSA